MGKIAFVFPGQGSQTVGMGQAIYNEYPEAKAIFDLADSILGGKMTQCCFNGPEAVLKDTRNAQPAILTTSVALNAVLTANGARPDFVAGHSLGEYSALVAAGALAPQAAIELVGERARLMAEADSGQNGAMAAVLGLERPTVTACLAAATPFGPVEAANFNCPGQIVISGVKAGVVKMRELVAARGGKFIPLAVSGPFHSSLMRPAAERFRPRLAEVTWAQPAVTLIANVDAQPAARENLTDNLYRQIFSAVLWEDTLVYLAKAGVDTFVEVGPGKVLAGLIKKTLQGVRILNCNNTDSIKKALAILKEV
ncbi:MAG: ACP S-malonyltransferase [Bacillota bacterium]|jgi:[acyl-carrier-protein] S-malonyltransferase